MKTLTACIVGAIVAAFLLGNVLHVLVPHSHDGSEIIAAEMHAALRHDEKKIITVASFALWLLVTVPLVVLLFPLPAYAEYPRHGKIALQTQRGISKHRRFR